MILILNSRLVKATVSGNNVLITLVFFFCLRKDGGNFKDWHYFLWEDCMWVGEWMGVRGVGVWAGVGACACWGCCLDSLGSEVFWLFLAAKDMILKPFSPSIVKGMGYPCFPPGATALLH